METAIYSPRKSKTAALLAFIILAIIFGGIGGYLLGARKNIPRKGIPPEGQVCNQEAKLCLDGSYVGRTGPNCEFASCSPSHRAKSESTPAPNLSSTLNTDKSENQSSKTINFTLCKPGDGYREYVGFGSTALTVKKDLESFCEVEIYNELEGGYTSYNCKVPRSIGKITIKISMYGSDFNPIMGYCEKIKSGNVLMELEKQ